ncbi:hypothetical protein EVAR_6221_1 [Eumeta japonica]|uniref:Uncharacterized protein n=1 Tax=Eumeta variegata TaxID=151549 RepID=A0A4C1Z2I5_EUMVA|nr:hypothetical protein EVAR_6221_1 [Eumeta japonica]
MNTSSPRHTLDQCGRPGPPLNLELDYGSCPVHRQQGRLFHCLQYFLPPTVEQHKSVLELAIRVNVCSNTYGMKALSNPETVHGRIQSSRRSCGVPDSDVITIYHSNSSDGERLITAQS